MSGPVIGNNNGGSVWSSVTGILINWQPFDFGSRAASVRAAKSARDRASAANLPTQLEVGTASADAYLSVIAALSSEQVAVRGDLSAGQLVVKQATDEIREGTSLR